MTETIILNDLTEQKARIDEAHAELKRISKAYPQYVKANTEWFIQMAGELCAATFCNERGDYEMAEHMYQKAEPNISAVGYKLDDCASDIDFE